MPKPVPEKSLKSLKMCWKHIQGTLAYNYCWGFDRKSFGPEHFNLACDFSDSNLIRVAITLSPWLFTLSIDTIALLERLKSNCKSSARLFKLCLRRLAISVSRYFWNECFDVDKSTFWCNAAIDRFLNNKDQALPHRHCHRKVWVLCWRIWLPRYSLLQKSSPQRDHRDFHSTHRV